MPHAYPVVIDLYRDTVKKGLADGSIALVDVREPHEFAAGHIPGSISLPLSVLDVEALEDAVAEAGGRRIVFSCAAGIRSVHAIERARAAGFDLREHYRGGFKDWLLAGEEVA